MVHKLVQRLSTQETAAHMSGDLNLATILRYKVYLSALKLEYNFTKYKLQQCINRDRTIGGNIFF